MLLGSRLDAEPEALFVSDSSQDARRVVNKAQAVQNAHLSGAQIRQAPVEIQQITPAVRSQRDGKGIDREISPVQVQLYASLLDGRQYGRLGIELCASSHKVEMRRKILLTPFLAWRLQVYPSERIVRLVKNPFGSAEAAVRDEASTAVRLYLLRQEDGVAFHHQVHVDRRRLSTRVCAVQYQVPHKTANDVNSKPHLGRDPADHSQKSVLRPGQGLLKFTADVWNLRLRLPILPPQLEQIRACYDACQRARFVHNRDLAPPAIDHQPVQLTNRRVGSDSVAPLAHYLLHR